MQTEWHQTNKEREEKMQVGLMYWEGGMICFIFDEKE